MSNHIQLLFTEVITRWSDLSLTDVDASNGDRERLIELLRVRCLAGNGVATVHKEA
jgi:hypothetical protein